MGSLIAVIGLGLGDEGKGSICDFLARKHSAKLVVRFNGGGQAGHNVIDPDGRHHTFSQFGSGTLAGARTHLSRYMLVDPFAMHAEERKIRVDCGITTALAGTTVEEECLVVTPFHLAANRLREWRRGAERHGTTGMGIGETVQDSITDPDMVIRVRDLADPSALANRLEYWRAKKLEEFWDALNTGMPSEIQREASVLLDRNAIALCTDVFSNWARRVTVVGREFLQQEMDTDGTVIFEGAQGVLLDEAWGFSPHTTWSDCTFGNVDKLIEKRSCSRIGVTRTYLTRHGEGPLLTECDELANLPEPHNASAGWQGKFRKGWLSVGLLRYAIDCCGPLDGIALTHLDRLLPGEADRISWGPDLVLPMRPSTIEEVTGVPITIGSVGPTATEKFWV